MRVIGTAGHVDHGKSTLVQALTGMNPDRLQEEQARAMTIDLGFAWLTLPNGEVVSIVDVPGHEDFIRNMLAGVGALDLALFVVAADESLMPQSREHLQILDLLKVPQLIVALTKCDLAEDEEWLELVEMEIEAALAESTLAGSPIVRLSARTGAGVETLVVALQQALQQQPSRPDVGRPRLSIDRAFTMAGFGTVLTGTLTDGSFAVGDEVVLLPSGHRGRIRGLQSNREAVERATPGRRLAVNVSGIDLSQAPRGELLAHVGDYRATRLIDVRLRLLADAPQPLRHNQEIDLFQGAAERIGHLRLIGTKEIRAGEEGFAQIRLREPLVVVRGDRFVLRRLSPSRTLGGGRVLDPHPPTRWRRFRPATLERFARLNDGSPTELLLETLYALEPTDSATLLARLTLPAEAASETVAAAIANGDVHRLADGTLLSAAAWGRRTDELLQTVADYHRAHPLRFGLPAEELPQRLALPRKAAQSVVDTLANAGQLRIGEGWVALPGFGVVLSNEQEQRAARLLAAFDAAPFTPPHPSEALAMLGNDEPLLAHLVARGDLRRLSADVLLSRDGYAQMVAGVRAMFERQPQISAADVRDRFNTSRKYAIALLEHLDAQRITRRVGNSRVLR